MATTGMPILILKAPGLKAVGKKPRVGQFDYLKYVTKLAGSKSQVTIELIEGTDHSFANRVGRAAVRAANRELAGEVFSFGWVGRKNAGRLFHHECSATNRTIA